MNKLFPSVAGIVRFTISALVALTLFALSSLTSRAEEPIASNTGPEPPFHGCRFYEHRNYGGHHFDVRDGHYYTYVGDSWNDKISSFACSYGCVGTIYEHRHFGGASVTWGPFVEYLGSSWNDRTSSMKVACTDPPPKPQPIVAPGMEDNIDRPGHDYDHFKMSSNYQTVGQAPSECRARCEAARGKCRAWTYVRRGVQDASDICYLKDDPSTPVQNACCISGTVLPTVKGVPFIPIGPAAPAPARPTGEAESPIGRPRCPRTIVRDPGIVPPPPIYGIYDTDFGVLTLSARGGTYTYNGGRVCIGERVAGVITGTWWQTYAAQRCADGTYHGPFRFNFTVDGFTGTYGYCEGPANAGPWNGRRR